MDRRQLQQQLVASTPDIDDILYDAEWEKIADRFKVYAHSHSFISEGLRNDLTFLQENNVMDYSMLVGIDEKKKELRVGLVDYIGQYNWYKRLETKGKTQINSAFLNNKSVTILEPVKYAERFKDVMRYFQVVPDKWSNDQ